MEKRKKISFDLIVVVFVACLIALKLSVLYLPFVKFGYLVPPGDDPANHYHMVMQVLAGKINFSYPPLFHIVIAWFSKIFHSEPMNIMRLITPALVVLPSLAVLVVTSKLFGRSAGLISFVVIICSSNYGLLAFGDGNYPNLIAGGLFLPLAFFYFIRSLQERRAGNYLLMILFIALLVLTHHLSTAMYIMIVFATFALMTLWNLYDKIFPKIWKSFAVFIGITLIISLFLYFLPIKTVFVNAIQSFGETGKVLSSASFSVPADLSEYPNQAGYLAWYFGIFSLLYALGLLLRDQKKNNGEKIAIVGLIAWFFIMFLASRTERIGLPGRFMRECYLPLAILSGLALKDLIISIPAISGRVILSGAFSLVILTNLVQINTGSYRSPEFFNKMIRFNDSDKIDASQIARYTTEDAVILANPTTPFLPAVSSRSVVFIKAGNAKNGEQMARAIGYNEATHVFVGFSTWQKPDPLAYPFFEDYGLISEGMDKTMRGSICPFNEFETGSRLYRVTEKCLDNLTK